ncbi:MAG: DUF2442 domain-containing protein [Cytophagales bacterium]|nr:DUF2442 domain-containing protein [Cytophagales bacterium]
MVKIVIVEKIEKILVLQNFRIKFFFDNGEVRIVDFKPFINKKGVLNKPLADPEYFRKVKFYDFGGGIYWPNELDVCIDYILYHSKPEKVTA